MNLHIIYRRHDHAVAAFVKRKAHADVRAIDPTKQRLIVDVVDILAIRLECKQCGASVSFKPESLQKPIQACPNCHHTWNRNNPTVDAAETLTQALRELQVGDGPAALPYRVQIEVERRP